MLILALFVILTAVALPMVHATPTVLLRTTSIVLLISAVLASNAVSSLSIGINLPLYSGAMHTSSIVLYIDSLLLIAGALAITPWAPNTLPVYPTPITATPKVSTYPLFILFTSIGGTCLLGASDLITVYISIEMQSFAVYIIASVLSRESETATHAGLLYFMLGGLSSSIILMGCALLYQYTGHTSLDSIFSLISLYSNNNVEIGIGSVGFVLIAVGFFFKITAAPFHNWGPDVYDGIPTISATWLAILPKISIIGFLLSLQAGLGGVSLEVFLNNSSYDVWTMLLLTVSFLSLLVGTIVGLAQTRVKRLLAYSTISHVGFLLLALSVYSEEATEAYLFYILQYTATALNAFIILLAIGYVLRGVSGTKYSTLDLTYIKELSGIFHMHPFLAISIGVSLFSIAGIPPLVGFYGKQAVLYSAINSGYIFMSIVAIVVSVISASYYLRIIRVVHFEAKNDPATTAAPEALTIPLTSFHSYSISVLTCALIGFIISPDIFLNSIRLVALSMYTV